MTSKLIAPLFSAVLAGCAAAHAGSLATIEGTVVDASGDAIASGKVRVTIVCGKVTRIAKVDRAGHFSVSGLPEGACTITSTATGLQPVALNVTASAGSIATVLVSMRPPMPEPTVMDMVAAAPEPPPMPAPAMPEAKADGRIREERAPMLQVAKKPAMARPMVPAGPPPPPPRDKAAAQPAAQQAAPAGAIRLDRARLRAANRAFAGVADELANEKELAADDDMVAGWAPVRVFPVPQYVKGYDGPRTDFRETIYWNPSVETNDRGEAEVAFVMSDAVTAFRATAEGFSTAGLPGAGQLSVQSKLPLTLDAHLPVEVTAGDKIRLPVSLTNETDQALEANLAAQFGSAFKLSSKAGDGKLRLAAGEKRSVMFDLDVVATSGTADVALALTTRGLKDELKKTIRVVPRGFPFELSASGTAKRDGQARHQLDLAGALPGSIRATVTMYPSPVAAMTKGMEGMIREPGGCFEQTSSTNYPNIMILGYLNSTESADAALVSKTQGVLDRGYKLLTGYETKQRGYEWFGQTPGHEALTAYGLMEFADMAKVYDVDHKMVERTADWLMSRRDRKGGFSRSQTALDTFGRASEPTTNAYIMWALAEAKRSNGLDVELAAQRTLGGSTKDPYLLALATNTNLLAAPNAAETAAMVRRLAGMQAKDGSFPGAKESITMSGGESLDIETTALSLLALIKASSNNEYDTQIRPAVEWLNARRGGYGQWGNTQATILGLKALTAYSEHARQIQAPGAATVFVNGKPAGTLEFDKGRKDALVWDDLASFLVPGNNVVEIKLDSAASLPYSIAIEYRSARPQSSPDAKVAITTKLLRTQSRMGEGVTLRAHIENKTADGIPMTLARVGIPGGMVFQTWQLKELRDKGVIDFYETRPREVILYWRALAPSAKKHVDLNLLSSVPGTYEAPASSAYLYYTAEDRAWTAPVSLTIDR
ncbi:MAG: alpha-2-macroglobulin family protein [Kofleriaceae bacterium]